MTLHVVYEHKCPQCRANYIPYDEDVRCPRCGLLEPERFDYIKEATASLRFNKMSYGTYTPMAWWVGSLGDHILSILFRLFDAYYESGGARDFDTFAAGFLDKVEWADQLYLRDHMHAIALRLFEELNRKASSSRS